jgi:predicted nucleic acid-binding protein
MKNLFVDTNIVIDLLSKREPFYQQAQLLFTHAIENKNIRLYVSTLTFANTHYLLSKHYHSSDVLKILTKFRGLVNVLAFDHKILDFALSSDFKDFEDAIQYYTASETHMNCIITRNEKDFKMSLLPVMTAEAYLLNYKK